MLRMATVLVVGAGASCDVRIPAGIGLRELISSKLKEIDNLGYFQLQDRDILETLYRYRSTNIEAIHPLVEAASLISRSLGQAESIDTYLDSHNEDEAINIVGKISIVKSILESERQSSLYLDRENEVEQLDYGTLSQTWYSRFFHLLVRNCPKSNVDSLFKNLTIICFNYGRCIEHYLFNATRQYYNLDWEAASRVLANLRIIHPYGTVGTLKWEKKKDHVKFGGCGSHIDLLSIAQRIKTFTEQIQETKILDEIHSSIQNADKLLFLGFAFHPQNLEILSPPTGSRINTVFGTTYGLSQTSLEYIEYEIRKRFLGSYQTKKVFLKPNLKCYEALEEYGVGITSDYAPLA